MKRTKLVALTLVVAIMLVGAGYAAWTDQLQITSTVSTGILDLDFTNVSVLGTDSPQLKNIESYITNLGDDADNGFNHDAVIINASNFYPGAKITRRITMKNWSTIDVKVQNVKLQASIPGAASETITPEPILEAMNVKVKMGNNVVATLPKDVNPVNINNIPANFVIPAGQVYTFDIEIELPITAENEVTESKNVQYQITADFKQFNQ